MSELTRPRPTHVVQRDRLVAIILQTTGSQPLSQVLERAVAHQSSIGDFTVLKSDDIYRSLWRLRTQGFVTKVSVGSRTPNWELTPEGVQYALQVQADGGANPAPPQDAFTPEPPQPDAPG